MENRSQKEQIPDPTNTPIGAWHRACPTQPPRPKLSPRACRPKPAGRRWVPCTPGKGSKKLEASNKELRPSPTNANLQIKIQLPKDRTQHGTLTLESNTQTLGPFECYGKADNQSATAKGASATRDPTKSFGAPPTGRYRGYVNKIAKENGRFGLLIHGGALNAAGTSASPTPPW